MKAISIKTIFFIIVIVLISIEANAQAYVIGGTTNVTAGSTHNYTVSDLLSSNSINMVRWSVDNGQVYQANPLSSTVDITFPSSPSSPSIPSIPSSYLVTITATVYDLMLNGYLVTLDVTVNPERSLSIHPPTPTIQSSNCGYTVLTSSNPSSSITGITLYWQSSSSGTSTSNSSSTITKTISGTQYLRARDVNGVWSAYSSSKSYTVNTVPPTPSTPTITSNCGSTVLTRGSHPSGQTLYWQSSSGGTSTGNSSSTVTRTSGTAYYLRARNNSTGCWSSSRTVSYTINQPLNWYQDQDGDGLGDPSNSQSACSQPSGGYVSNNNDQCPTQLGTSGNNGCPLAGALSDENYIHTTTYRTETTTGSVDDDEKIESITYFDGLGRPMQSIGIRAGGNSEDIITHIGYDYFGRQDKDYLPYATSINHGLYRANALNSTTSFYNTAKYENTTNPYSQKTFDNSPLNRIKSQAAPGYDWRKGGGHEIAFDYQTNTFDSNNPTNANNDNVRLYKANLLYANNTYTPTLVINAGAAGYYAAGELYKTITKDENWKIGNAHTTEEFKDKQGRVVLKRTHAVIERGYPIPHDTYYVYDDFGNLTYVIPPKVDTTDEVSSTELNELCYQYKYDYRNRLVEKKIPGKGWEYIVYNKLDQPIMTQDTIQNAKPTKEWLFTKYDAFGRVAYTGLITTNISSRHLMQSTVDGISSQWVTKSVAANTIGNTIIYYNNTPYPNTNISEIHTINYYDNYTFDGFTNMPSNVDGQTLINHNNSSGTQKLTKGLATGSKVRVLDSSPVKWITTTTGYDEKGRAIYVKSVNEYLNTTDVVENLLDFTGAVTKTKSSHDKGTFTSVDIEDLFTYDHAGRLLKQTQELNNTNVLEVIVENNYDDLGQLTSKDVGGKTTQGRLQNIDFTYNIRGWLKQINNTASLGNDLFGFKINYNTVNHGGTALFNGNISETEWRTANTDSSLKWYYYYYDELNRITGSRGDTNNYNLSSVAYDKNGNITTLSRKGHTNSGATTFGIMDNLTYLYGNGNNLLSVSDSSLKTQGFNDGNTSGNDYTYDANGNMLSDANKGIINITYNHLNLPTLIDFGSGSKIEYFYDATGIKLKKNVIHEGGAIGTHMIYAGNYVYDVTRGNGTLKFFNHPEGYVDVNGSTYKYVYQYKDHLGNIRLSYKDISTNNTPNLQIIEENNYYPFGLEHKGYNNVVSSNSNSVAGKYKFNGKELQDELGLDMYDYGARNYQPDLGRWMNVDPLAEKFMPVSPYHFAGNNPNIYVDDNGKDFTIYFEQNEDGDWQIRISATYYVKKGDKDSKAAADKAVGFWNKKSGDFSLTTENDQKQTTGAYGVKFDLNVIEVENPEEELKKDYAGAEDAKVKDGSSNIFSVVPDGDLNTPGLATGLNKIQIRDEVKDSYQAGAHEIGHTLGIKDRGTNSSSVMNGGYTGSSSVLTDDILDIINFAEKYQTPQRVNIVGKIPKGTAKKKRRQRKVKRN